MNAKLEEPAANRTTGGEGTGPSAVRTVRHPSADFPMTPPVEMGIPESWRPIGAVVVNEMRTRPDIAVAGPDVVDGVRPNIMVKISQAPPGSAAAALTPAELLDELFARQRAEESAAGYEQRIHAADTDPQPYGVSRYRERVGEVEVQRLTCAVIVSAGPATHLVVVQASLSPADDDGLSAIEAAFASLRVAAPTTSPGPVEQNDGDGDE